MKLRPTLRFTTPNGGLASIPMPTYETIEAGEYLIDAAIAAAKAEGGTNLELRLVTPDGEINVYRWFD
jgi:hypothetical protein